MCGVAGEVWSPATGARGGDARARVGGMVDAMRHRGPDGDGFHQGDGVSLGMCRLAIIDVAGGDQPMATADGRWHIVYNGEVYGTDPLRRELEGRGRAFRTRSDTEVVLNALAEHGAAGLSRLNGMFAFAVWDQRERELWLGRDRLGIKPLFYWQQDGRLVFSSTLAAIAGRDDFRGTLDAESLELYLANRFVVAPRTLYREIRKLPPGHFARWRDGRLTVERWWEVPIPERPRRISAGEAAEEVSALLADSARLRLVSERPVGLCLSGGIDSGLLAHALRSDRVETFSLGFADPSYDESPTAARVAAALGLPHHVLRADLDAARDIDAVLAHYDEPVADPSGVALYELSRLLSAHVTVALSGTGGDELFGGYRRIVAGLLARGTRHLPLLRWLPPLLGRDESKLGWRKQLAQLAGAAGLPPLKAYRRLLAPTPDGADLRRPELVAAVGDFDAASVFREPFERARGSLLTRLLYTDLHTVLADDYLVKEDRMTMAHSVEGRVPFLDYRMVELAFSLPDELKIDGLTTKVLLRRMARARLPAEIAGAPKQGFEIPVAAWLRTALADRVRALADPSARIAEFLDPVAVSRAIGEHLDERADHGRLLWTLLTLEHFLRRSPPATLATQPAAPRKTRLLVVSSSMGEGGAQRVTSTLLAHIDRDRFDATLCLFKPLITYPVPADVPVTVIGSDRDAPLAELAARRPWLVGDLILRLRRHIAEARPDVVLSTMDQVNSVTGTALAGLSPRPRWVARIAADPAQQSAVAAAWARITLRGADAVVVSSAELGDGVARFAPATRPRLQRLPNLTDFERIDAAAAQPPARRRTEVAGPLVIAVGRLSPQKRPDLMLDAIERVRRERPVTLWMCGDGPLADELRADIARRGLTGAVELLGFCENPYALMASADLYLLASDFEGMPNGLIEAQGLGVPAVAARCPFGVAEVVADGETGLLVPPGDGAALAGGLLTLLADPDRRAAMGRAARVRARERFGAAALIRDWQQVLARRAS